MQWQEIPAAERERMVAAARLALMEIEDSTATKAIGAAISLSQVRRNGAAEFDPVYRSVLPGDACSSISLVAQEHLERKSTRIRTVKAKGAIARALS